VAGGKKNQAETEMPQVRSLQPNTSIESDDFRRASHAYSRRSCRTLMPRQFRIVRANVCFTSSEMSAVVDYGHPAGISDISWHPVTSGIFTSKAVASVL
jgi:hypothetical protein